MMGGAALTLPNIPMFQCSNRYSPLPPMAGLFVPAMNRLLTRANRDRPRHPERGSSPNGTPLP
jgi:hypothetical protein